MKVWILEKLEFYPEQDYGGRKLAYTSCFAFASFRKASRAMLDDITDEYVAGKCKDDDKDRFYTDQPRPSADDRKATLELRCGICYEWKIHETELEK